jgi:protein-glutamine gamma-glutamyltransferase
VLVGVRPVTEPITYTAVSDTAPHGLDPMSALALSRDLQIPPLRNPRSVELGRRLRREAGSDSAFVRSVLEFLRTGGFRYTLTPPRLGLNSVDDFLFHTHLGFCEHFASAFVVLMRAGGVPARVVTGYLGGEWNPIGGYLLVRESDAHAWAEVWLQGRGWTRVDPTLVVAPERLTRDIDEFLPGTVSAPERLLLEVPWIVSIREGWDAVNAWWTNEVVGFDSRAQLGLLRRLGIAAPGPAQLGRVLAVCLIGWLAAMGWHLGRLPPPPRPDRLARAYRRLCLKLARAGLPRAPDQGPTSYADLIATRRPDLAPTARLLLASYAELRFGSPVQPDRGMHGGPAPHDGVHAGVSAASRLADFERAVVRWRIPRRRPAPRRSLTSQAPRSARESRGT